MSIAPPDSVTPQEGVLSVQTDDNLSFFPVELVASELMTSLNDTGGGDRQPPLNGVSTVESPEEQDNGSPGQGDAVILLSFFSAVAGAEVKDDADVNTPATVAPDEMVPVGQDVPDEPVEMEDVLRHNDIGADCLLPGTEGVLGYPVNAGADARLSGETFLAWLSDGMVSGRITVNQHDSRVHTVAGFIYLLVPDIFFLFLKDTGSDSHREQIQTSFEKLQLHRVRKGERFTRAKLFCSENKQGRFSRVNGYLIKVARLKGVRPPEDSKLLFFP
ncbi:DNA-binding domain-containing protein [Erwinia tracheiphila]|uniref:conjugal transfer nickase/helicase domain-containing protein n=1 Tax=Erwinia tracheiphila TaxID=65700 RepID=UPI001F3BDE32|nr:DNA-binding domain-containing protein [Erwinia tracheiphila]UIA84343.1 DNA-binding domain-containing protein [Erwinia tracheiphila]UIA92926.1 DNA-binding domain-containing protein [Erwinia tracheiphila]